jgi:hypothetical protein
VWLLLLSFNKRPYFSQQFPSCAHFGWPTRSFAVYTPTHPYIPKHLCDWGGGVLLLLACVSSVLHLVQRGSVAHVTADEFCEWRMASDRDSREFQRSVCLRIAQDGRPERVTCGAVVTWFRSSETFDTVPLLTSWYDFLLIIYIWCHKRQFRYYPQDFASKCLCQQHVSRGGRAYVTTESGDARLMLI